MHIYEIRARKKPMFPGDVDLISDQLPRSDRNWYGNPNAIKNAIAYAAFRSRGHQIEVRIFDEAGKLIATKHTKH